MKKILMLILGLVLALSLIGAGFAAAAPAKSQTQAVCPVLGGKVNKAIYADYQGKRIYFCCSGCIEQFKNNPEKYLKKLEEQGITPDQTPAGK